MSFITAWIESCMEDPYQRQHDEEKRIRAIADRRLSTLAKYRAPLRGPNWWKDPVRYKAYHLRAKMHGSDRRQTKYKYDATSFSNSYDALLDISNRQLERQRVAQEKAQT